MNPFYHDLSDVDLCFSTVLYTTSIVYWAPVVIDRVPSRISKPVAGSEGHQTAGMDRSDQGFHTFAISLSPSHPTLDFLAPSNFISRPLPQLSIFPPLVPRATALCHKPLAGTHPAPFSVPFLRKTNSGNLCHRDMGITHFPTPLTAPPSMICPPSPDCQWSSLRRAFDCIIWNCSFFWHKHTLSI